MKPLLFLTGRTIVNSVRRAFLSPTRLIGVIFILFWWFAVVGANFFPGGSPSRNLPLPPPLPESFLPILHLVLLGGFLALLVLRLTIAFRVPGHFQGADADVLFATPISPRIVLLHRFIFDYLFTLLLPLILFVFGGKQSWRGLEFLASGMEDPAQAAKMVIGAHLLLTLFGVSLSYATGLWVNRDSHEGRTGRRIALTLLLTLAGYLVGGVIGAARSPAPVDTLLAFSNTPMSRIILLPVHSATNMVLGFIEGPPSIAWAGAAVLIVGSLVCLTLAILQANHLYDMAATQVAGAQARRDAQIRGDVFSVYHLYAQQGRLKARKPPFVYNKNLRGPMAILWREVVLQFRTYVGLFVMMLLFVCLIGAVAVITPKGKAAFPPIALIAFNGLMILSYSMASAQGGFLEMLRRVDVQKPLPFPMRTICLMEILGKSTFPALLGIFSSLIIMIATLDLDSALATLFALPTTAAAVVAVQLIIILNFPDVDDPTQRGFRAMLQFLGALAASSPAIALFGVSKLAGVPLFASGALSACFAIGIVVLCAWIAAPFYANFNPAD